MGAIQLPTKSRHEEINGRQMIQPLQFDLLEARRRRDMGIARVSGNNQKFIDWARHTALLEIHRHGSVTIDSIRDIQKFYGVDNPTHRNAYGAIFRDKRFKPIGFTPSKQVSNHGRRIIVWGLA